MRGKNVNFKKQLLAATMVVLPMGAHAQLLDARVQGLYIGAGFGANYLQGASELGIEVGVEWGYAGVLSVGYGFGNGLRLELEGRYRENDINIKTSPPIGRLERSLGGSVSSYGAMFNALYDFNLGVVLPYVGAGVGYQISKYESVRGVSSNGNTLSLGSDEGTFAYQGIVGVGLPVEAVAGLALTLEYRFLGTVDNAIEGTLTTPRGTVSTASVSVNNFNHSIMFGVRYNFGRTAAQVPVAAAAPVSARTFLVFFDWNRAELTARARQIIGEAAQARTRQQVTRLEVTGHTDSSGSPTYNQGLSTRRANAVAAELVRLGVPRNEIVTRGVGESQLLVPTTDNVREPQNRRVEIVLR